MAFVYLRTVFFRDTDAAGVVYFTNVLSICHEAYEASLAASGVDLKQFFGKAKSAFPIAHASVDFFRPMFCGDRLAIQMQPKQTKPDEFEITYHLFAAEADSLPEPCIPSTSLSRALSRHVCIDSTSRTRSPLSAEIIRWLDQWSE